MKNKILIPLLVGGVLSAFFSFKYIKANTRSSDEKRKLVVQTVLRTIEAAHFAPREIDDTFSTCVYQRMVNAFDYDKLYFTQQDINKLAGYQYKIDDQIRTNSLEFFDSLDAIFLRRLNGAEKFYPELLAKPFSFTGNEELQLNPEKESYASSDKGLTDRWKTYLKFRVLGKYVELKTEQDKKKENKDSVSVKLKTDAELEVIARDDIKKFYTRYFKSVRKRKDDERFTFFVNTMAEAEDPHTAYFPPVEKKSFDEMMSGSFVGIGAQLKQDNDKTVVTSIVTGSPSWKQGDLKAEDEIQKVAQGNNPPVDIQGFEIDEVVKIIRGEKGTEVRLHVKKQDGSFKIIPIIRGVVEREETFAKSAIINSKDGPIGYINLPEFYADFNHTSGRTCAADVEIEVKKLKAAGVKGIILDLRNNGGGSLGDVVDMTGLFVGRGPVVQVKTNRSSPSVLKSHSPDTALYTGPLAIMVNQNSASASEILAAALQDYKRAVIVGALTYGKGTVQKMVGLDDMVDPVTRLAMASDTDGAQGKSLGSVKLTMEKFYRVNGGSTQLKGVTPDVIIPDAYDGYEDEELGERHNKSALAWDEIPPANYRATNSLPNVKQLAAMSATRVAANPTFRLIQENSEYLKKKKDDNRVSLNEVKYKKDQEERTAISKKVEELQKKSVPLEMVNIPADINRVTMDSSAASKNREWLKNFSKDIYIAETVNILNDIPMSGMKVVMPTGMK